MPCLIDRLKGGVLRYHQFHGVAAIAAVAQEPLVGFPGGDGPRAGTYCLEIITGNLPDGGHRRQYRGAHSVAAGHIFGAPFGNKPFGSSNGIRKLDGVEIVASHGGAHQFYATMEGLVEPKGVKVDLRNHQQKGYAVLRTDFGKGACGISSGSHHQDFPIGRVETPAYRISFRLLEGTGGHGGPPFRPPSAEGDPEVMMAQGAGQPLAPVSDRSRRTLQNPSDWQPVGKLIQSGKGFPDRQLTVLVYGLDEGGIAFSGGVKYPSGIGESSAGFYRLQEVPGLFKTHFCLLRKAKIEKSI